MEDLASHRGRAAMLTILGNAYRFCDGLSRRAFLKVGDSPWAG